LLAHLLSADSAWGFVPKSDVRIAFHCKKKPHQAETVGCNPSEVSRVLLGVVFLCQGCQGEGSPDNYRICLPYSTTIAEIFGGRFAKHSPHFTHFSYQSSFFWTKFYVVQTLFLTPAFFSVFSALDRRPLSCRLH
jgi:hypothetical protein